MSYQPQPGTIAYRAIEWLKLQPAGTEVTASVWAEAVDTDGATLTTTLKPSLDAGLVRRDTKAGTQRPFFFSLGDGVPLHKPAHDEEQDLLPHRNVAPDVKPRPGEMLPGVRGNEPVPQPEPKPEPGPLEVPRFVGGMTLRECAEAEERKPARDFDAWFSGHTGEVVLQGVTVDEDGDVVLSKQQVRVVLAALSGVAV